MTMPNPIEILIAETAADYAADMIDGYDILIGINQIALIYRPNEEFVQIYNNGRISMDQLMIDLSKHSMQRRQL